jgi:hypothetical protein
MDFREDFDGPEMASGLKWYNPPPEFALSGGQLIVRPAKGSDFWQKTHYGFAPDSGHFLHLDLTGDFVMETHVHYRFVGEYDQAGLMVRNGPELWLKTSVEYRPLGLSTLGVVVTRGVSDWSMAAFEEDHVYLRVKRLGNACGVYFALKEHGWKLIRMAYLPLTDPVQAGVFAASPTDSGLEARFDYLSVRPTTSPYFEADACTL